MLNLLYLPFIIIHATILKYDSYEIYFNLNSNLIINTIYKISNYWSMIDNNVYFIVFIISMQQLFTIIKKNEYTSINLSQLFLLLLIISFSVILTSNLYYLNNSLFNPLLTHFLVFIHPPLILIITVITRINIEKKKHYLFYYYTMTTLLGSLWATSVFGWGGWWSWDPIEHISLTVWMLLFLYIHKMRKITSSFLLLFYLIDLFLFLFFKFNSFQSVHIFKIIYLDMQPFFIYIYMTILCITIFLINNIKYKHRTNINLAINNILIFLLLIISYIIVINITPNIYILYYIILMLITIYTLIATYILQIKNNTIVLLLVIILNTMSIQYIVTILTLFKYIKKHTHSLYRIHILCGFLIFILLNINDELYEFIFTITHTYTQEQKTILISNIDININYIEFNNSVINQEKYDITTYYNIYNIFEKIELTIYHSFINSTYINIKNNILQLYKIKYIILLFLSFFLFIKK